MSTKKYLDELISLLEVVISRLADDSDMSWTKYESAIDLKKKLFTYIQELKADNLKSITILNLHFAPTSTFQELSISNGWSDEYIRISTVFDEIYKLLNNDLWE